MLNYVSVKMNYLQPTVCKIVFIYTYIIKHLEQNVTKGQGYSTNALKSLFLHKWSLVIILLISMFFK